MLASLYRHRGLVFELTKREFSGRYRGSYGGTVWSFTQPLFLLAVYTLAFGVILKTRWSSTGSTTEYALILFAGLIVFNAFSEVLNKSPTLISGHPNFVKKVVFPLELLPVVTTATALLHALIGVAVWLAGYVVLIGIPAPSVLLVPAVLACFVPMLLGVGWLLSSVGVVVKDVQQLTSMLGHALLFVTPIFYSIDTAPPVLQRLLALNPLTLMVGQFRGVLFHGQLPSWGPLAAYVAATALFAWLSLLLFRRLRPTFADLV